jgi:hypothetical protein
MKVWLGNFVKSGIESQLGTDLRETVKIAISHYTAKLESGRPPIAPPPFLLLDASGQARGEGEEVELTLDRKSEAVLRREAFRRHMDVGNLATHSVMVYLAELDFISAPTRTV